MKLGLRNVPSKWEVGTNCRNTDTVKLSFSVRSNFLKKLKLKNHIPLLRRRNEIQSTTPFSDGPGNELSR